MNVLTESTLVCVLEEIFNQDGDYLKPHERDATDVLEKNLGGELPSRPLYHLKVGQFEVSLDHLELLRRIAATEIQAQEIFVSGIFRAMSDKKVRSALVKIRWSKVGQRNLSIRIVADNLISLEIKFCN